jgi:hypothetical protein
VYVHPSTQLIGCVGLDCKCGECRVFHKFVSSTSFLFGFLHALLIRIHSSVPDTSKHPRIPTMSALLHGRSLSPTNQVLPLIICSKLLPSLNNLIQSCKTLRHICQTLSTPQCSLANISVLNDVLSSFVKSTDMASFAPSELSLKAKKRLRKHFERRLKPLATELHHLLSHLRSTFLYDSGALTVGGARAMVQYLQLHLTSVPAVQDLVVIAIGEGDALFFARRQATLDRFSMMVQDLQYRPVLVDVSPSLSRPNCIPWSDTEQTTAIVASMKAVLSALQKTGPNDRVVLLPTEQMHPVICIVGMLLEYPVVYGIFQDKTSMTGNCAAADTLCRCRLLQHSGLGNAREEIILPWSFTIPKALSRNIFVRLAKSLFYNTVLKRIRAIQRLRRVGEGNGNGPGKEEQGRVALSWAVEEVNVTSVCL